MVEPVDLVAEIGKYALDPLGFVLMAYDWGEGELAGQSGPRQWQRDYLDELGQKLRRQVGNEQPIRKAVVSGNGIGKSVMLAWLVDWAMSTMPDCKVVVTANTAKQLETKTWPEVIKWHRRSINADWFTATATSLAANDPKRARTWRADAVPWSPTNTEAFAGLHNQGRRILIIFDEASGIDDLVWDVTEGALTDANTEILWLAFGNYTRNTGKFDEAIQARRAQWSAQQIDSRTVEGVNQAVIAEWKEVEGEDSDFFCARVSAKRPRFGVVQFISNALMEQSHRTMPLVYDHDPVVMGVDVAGYGDDEAVIYIRRGRDGRTVPPQCFKNLDLMQLVGHIIHWIELCGGVVDMIFVDQTGIGRGVVSRLQELGYRCMGVDNGAVSDVDCGTGCANKAAEMWARGREWLKTGGAVHTDVELLNQCTNRTYTYNSHGQVLLERKSDMKKRGVSSPDRADAFFLTFAYPVASRATTGMRMQQPAQAGALQHDYDPLAAMDA